MVAKEKKFFRFCLVQFLEFVAWGDSSFSVALRLVQLPVWPSFVVTLRISLFLLPVHFCVLCLIDGTLPMFGVMSLFVSAPRYPFRMNIPPTGLHLPVSPLVGLLLALFSFSVHLFYFSSLSSFLFTRASAALVSGLMFGVVMGNVPQYHCRAPRLIM